MKLLALLRVLARAPCVLLVALCCLPAIAQSSELSFYDATAEEISGKPGTLIRQETMSNALQHARAHRVLYRTTAPGGRPIAASGLVIVPEGPAPAGGRPVVVWAHPTSGIARHCAPSLAHFVLLQIQGMRDMLARGYIIAAPDYPGLGTGGPHPYLVGESEGRAVLDAVRAARNLVGEGAQDRFAIWGHSQGGQAALFAGRLAHDYAPELHLAGIAAAAPATDLGALMRDDFPTPGGKNILAMTLWSWARVFGISLDNVVDPAAIPTIDRLAQVCLESPIDIPARRRDGQDLERTFLSVSVDQLTSIEPWKSLLAQNTAGVLPSSIPIFLAQGLKDDTVVPAVTRAYMKRLCAAGSRVRMVTLPNAGHGVIARDTASDAVSWIADRFAGQTAPDECAGN